MELNINTPAYYSTHFWIDDEIYWMCDKLRIFMKDKDYSEQIKCIGIVPVVAPKKVIEKGSFKQMKKCEVKAGFASISLHIDFITYVNASIEEKKVLIIKNVLESVKAVAYRGKIDYKRFKQDVLTFCEENNIQLDGISI